MSVPICSPSRSAATRTPNTRVFAAMQTGLVRALAWASTSTCHCHAAAASWLGAAHATTPCRCGQQLRRQGANGAYGSGHLRGRTHLGFTLQRADDTAIGAALASAGLPTVFTSKGGYAVEPVGVSTVNCWMGLQAPTEAWPIAAPRSAPAHPDAASRCQAHRCTGAQVHRCTGYCRAVRTLGGGSCGWLLRQGLMSRPPRRV